MTLTATIITSAAVDRLLHIHDRNPVPLPRDWWDDWLNPEIIGDQKFVDAAVHAALPIAGALDIRQVGPVRGDGPNLIEAVWELEGTEDWLSTETPWRSREREMTLASTKGALSGQSAELVRWNTSKRYAPPALTGRRSVVVRAAAEHGS